MEKDPGGFSETVVSDAGEIFTNASRFVGTLARTHLEALAPDSSLLLVANRRLSLMEVCVLMSA
jgi:hypothetical protein